MSKYDFDLNKLKNDFQKETGVPLYDAMQMYFGEYDSKYFCYNDKSACEVSSKGLILTAEKLCLLCKQDNNLKKELQNRHIKEFADVSEEKCEHPECARYSSMYTAILPFLNESKIKENLRQNPSICWNPFRILNHPNAEKAVCIFKPSDRLLKIYPFIKKQYSGKTRTVIYYYVDMNELKAFRSGDISIEHSDILQLNLRYLHPYHWGLIQDNNFTSLKKLKGSL